MIFFLLSLSLFACCASSNFTSFINKGGQIIHFLKNPSPKDSRLLTENGYVQEAKNSQIAPGYYLLSNENQEMNQKIESLIYSVFIAQEKIYLNVNEKEKAIDVLKLIVDKKNFQDDGRLITVRLCDDLVSLVGFENLLALCFDKQLIPHLTIETVEADRDFTVKDIVRLFDPGIGEYCNNLTEVLNKKYGVGILTEKVQRYSRHSLRWGATILNHLDSRYPYTMAFFEEEAPRLTVLHSREFRQNFLYYIRLSLFVILPIVIVFGAVFMAKFRST